MTGLQEVRRSPVVVWNELAAAVAARRSAREVVFARRDLDVQISALARELHQMGLVEEIGEYLAVTYGGRP